MASLHMQNSDDYRGGECQVVNNIPRGGGGVEGKGYICLKAKLT